MAVCLVSFLLLVFQPVLSSQAVTSVFRAPGYSLTLYTMTISIIRIVVVVVVLLQLSRDSRFGITTKANRHHLSKHVGRARHPAQSSEMGQRF